MSKSRNLRLAGRILLKQYIRECVHSKQEYVEYVGKWLTAYERPCTDPWSMELDKRYAFISSYHKYDRNLFMVTIFCAACGEDTDLTAGNKVVLQKIFTGENIYCRNCLRKVSYQTRELALKNFDYIEKIEFDEILTIAKQLSPKDITPRAFK